jgi:uncharacterized OsmC-like protein
MSVVTFKATSHNLPTGLAVENVARGFRVVMDEPKELGGSDTGMNPVEMLLCALGSCQAIVAKSFAKAHGIDLHDFLVVLEGDLDPDGFLKGKPGVRPGFQEIRFAFYLETNASQDKVDQFVEFIKSRCPVGDMLLNGVRIVQSDVVVRRSPVYA